jgi:arylsulfatase A-like enzyme
MNREKVGARHPFGTMHANARAHKRGGMSRRPNILLILTDQHGVTQTDGIAKSADGDDMFWLAPDSVPRVGDWFRAGGYRTYYKGKWHVSHPYVHRRRDDRAAQAARR